MSSYQDLGIVELVEANLRGEYGDMLIDRDTALRNLDTLLPMLLNEQASVEAVCNDIKDSEICRDDGTWKEWTKESKHLRDLVARVREAIA